MPVRRPHSKSLLVLFAGAMIVSAMVLAVATWSRLNSSIEERTRLRSTILGWEQLLSVIKDAETGQRGYIITGDESYLKPFNEAVERIPAVFQIIGGREQSGDASYSTADLIALQQLVNRKLEELRESITVTRREGKEQAAKLVIQGNGRQLMDDIRTHVGGRLATLERRLDAQNQVMSTDLRWGFYSVAATCATSLIAGFAAWTLLRQAEMQARREERLAAEKRRAEQADHEKSVFLATMSHEIRTPMNAILGFGELLVGEANTPKATRYAQSIVRSGHSLLQIINDILDLSKIEAGMMELHPESTDVRELAIFVQQLLTTQATGKGIEIHVEVAEDVPSSLMLDSTRLRQVLINLAGNAFKFTDEGRITLRFHGAREGQTRSQYHLVVEVEDTGVGIPSDRLHDIFKPFVQAGAKREAESRGTGLGLAIVKRLTTIMGGTINVMSEEGKGSTFRLDIPGVDISARLPQALIPEEPVVSFNELRPSQILVVDDNPVNRELVRGFFEGTHHTVREAADGQEALDAMLSERPDVVLMDIRMPVMDGRAALKAMRLRKELDLLPVIAVTASSMAGEENALRETFDGYVRKPFSRAQLYNELSQFIPRQQSDGLAEAAPADDAAQPPPESWRVLIDRLRLIKLNTWPAVRDGMVLSEVTSFAKMLDDLAKEYECAPLAAFASRMCDQSESFAVIELEKTLGTFPGILADLEQRFATS